MSLQVWLPFTKDISNQGLSSIVPINGGATIDTSGKLGSCYSFTGSNYVALPMVILPSKTANWSFSCWFYLTDITTTTAECLFSERTGTNYNGYSIFIYPNNGKMLIDDGARWTVTPMTFAATTWYHLVITRNPQGKALYINGELKASTTTVGNTTAINTNGCLIGLGQSNSTLTAGGQGFKGKLNDVRIYDHTLSVKEVKELAKGLVLHYKLDSPKTVVWNIEYDCSGYDNHANIIGTPIIDDTSGRFNSALHMTNSGTANRIESQSPINIGTDALTMSFWGKFDKTKSQIIVADKKIEWATNTSDYAWVSSTSLKGFSLAKFVNNAWNHIVVVRTGSTYQMYINGQAAAQNGSNNNWTHNSDNLYLLNRNYNNNYAADASIADFRIYATAFSAEDVLELYNTSASIDNHGNGYARELIETNGNVNITKVGQWRVNELIDDDGNTTASITKTNKELKVNTFYEY